MIRIFAAVAVLSIAMHLFAQSSTRQPAATSDRVIFAVWPGVKGEHPVPPTIDPIVVFDGSQFKQPVKYENNNEAGADYDAFVANYFKSGQKYPLLFGGSEIGTVSVQGIYSEGCESLLATADLSALAPHGQRALAISKSRGLALHANWRKLPSAEQQTSFVKLAVEYLAQKGLAHVAASTIHMMNLRATKLGTDRPDALVGSVHVKDKTTVYNLFLIAEQAKDQWNAVHVTEHIARDVQDDADSTEIIEEDFVDQLDLNGDGTDEIFTMNGYYESWDYTIYKFESGLWKKVYQGAGGGC